MDERLVGSLLKTWREGFLGARLRAGRSVRERGCDQEICRLSWNRSDGPGHEYVLTLRTVRKNGDLVMASHYGVGALLRDWPGVEIDRALAPCALRAPDLCAHLQRLSIAWPAVLSTVVLGYAQPHLEVEQGRWAPLASWFGRPDETPSAFLRRICTPGA